MSRAHGTIRLVLFGDQCVELTIAAMSALIFRYGDDSLWRCLDFVCTDQQHAYKIARRGFAMRDRQPFRFGDFDSIVKPTQKPLPGAEKRRRP